MARHIAQVVCFQDENHALACKVQSRYTVGCDAALTDDAPTLTQWVFRVHDFQ